MLCNFRMMADRIIELDPKPDHSKDGDHVDLPELATMLKRTGPLYVLDRSNPLFLDGIPTTYEAVLGLDGTPCVRRLAFFNRRVWIDNKRVVVIVQAGERYHGARQATEVPVPD